MNSAIKASIEPVINTIHQGILFIFGNWYITTCASFFPKSPQNLCT